jgi:hypothetical protein
MASSADISLPVNPAAAITWGRGSGCPPKPTEKELNPMANKALNITPETNADDLVVLDRKQLVMFAKQIAASQYDDEPPQTNSRSIRHPRLGFGSKQHRESVR